MNKIMIIGLSFLAFSAQAMVAPNYFMNRKIDVAVGAIGKKLDIDQTDLRISLIEVNDNEDETITVATDELSCEYKIISKKMPAGMAGSPQLLAKQIGKCSSISAAATVSYEQVEAKMATTAAKGQTISKISVNNKGKIVVAIDN